MGTAISPERRQRAYEFFDGVTYEFGSPLEFRRAHKFSARTLKALKADWAGERELEKRQKKGLIEANKVIARGLGAPEEWDDGERLPGLADYLDEDGNFDLKKAINVHLKEIFDGLKLAAQQGNAQAGKILLQVSGDLVEESKAKVTHDFDIRGAVQKAQKELADWKARGGVGEVHDEPPLLPNGVHVAPEQGTDGDPPV